MLHKSTWLLMGVCLCLWPVVFIFSPLPDIVFSSPSRASSTRATLHRPSTPVRVVIVEGNGWHDEVVAALVYAFGMQPRAHVSLQQTRQRFNMQEIIDSFAFTNRLTNAIITDELNSASQIGYPPDAIVLATCERDVIKFTRQLQELHASTQAQLFCVAHYAQEWSNKIVTTSQTFAWTQRKDMLLMRDALLPWISSNRLRILALSPHTKEFIAQQLRNEDWAQIENISRLEPELFVPVFPRPARLPSPNNNELVLNVQGHCHSGTRDFKGMYMRYRAMMAAISRAYNTSDTPRVKIQLVGECDVKLPMDLEAKGWVSRLKGLDYKEYYDALADSFALLTTFTEESPYYTTVASSTIASSLIAGVPVISNDRLLSAYRYLSPEATWPSSTCQPAGKGFEMDTLATMLSRYNRSELARLREDKRVRLDTLNRHWIDSNLRQTATWLLYTNTQTN